MPTKSGCFLFKCEILHEMSRGSSCLALAHGSSQIFILARELRGIGSGFMFTSKGNRSHIIADGKLSPSFATYSVLFSLIAIFVSLPTSFWPLQLRRTSSKARNFLAANIHAEKKTHWCGCQKYPLIIAPTGNYPPVSPKYISSCLIGESWTGKWKIKSLSL